jgi:hypothetical protein
MLNKMTNYIIDGSINFYEELMKDEETDENNVCLLSNLPLDETHIELPCSHKFNYIYIFNEVKSSKKPNYLNIGYNNNYSLSSNEIKCPYCRKRFDQLLPPCKNIEGATLLKNVNTSNKTLNIKCKEDSSQCEQVYVTDIGYYCSQHYKKHKKNTVKKQSNIKNKHKGMNPKKHTKESCNCHKNINNIMDSSMNMIMDSSMNMIMDSSIFVVCSVKLNYDKIIDLSELKYNISKKYTIQLLKDILKKHNFPLSGKKDELIQRIIDKNLYKLI